MTRDADAPEYSKVANEGGQFLGRPIEELRDTGLLWLINRQVFHPRGYALALHVWPEDHERAGEVAGWSILGDGVEPWNFTDGDEDQFLAATKVVMP